MEDVRATKRKTSLMLSSDATFANGSLACRRDYQPSSPEPWNVSFPMNMSVDNLNDKLKHVGHCLSVSVKLDQQVNQNLVLQGLPK